MCKILLVEDNPDNRDMLCRRLSRRGHEVTVAVDGEQCLRMASGGGYEVILMDLSLPGVDGWEATRRLKSDPATRPLRVIALSAHAMVGDRELAREAGCDDYETKPVELARLLIKIESVLAAGPAAEPCPASPSGLTPTAVDLALDSAFSVWPGRPAVRVA